MSQDIAKLTKVEYTSNNSGGGWWLTDENWIALEKAGWEVQWFKNDPFYKGAERFLGGLARSATRTGLSMGDAIREWEAITGENSAELGCSCCGTPHSFSDDKGNYYSPSFPVYGNSYED